MLAAQQHSIFSYHHTIKTQVNRKGSYITRSTCKIISGGPGKNTHVHVRVRFEVILLLIAVICRGSCGGRGLQPQDLHVICRRHKVELRPVVCKLAGLTGVIGYILLSLEPS